MLKSGAIGVLGAVVAVTVLFLLGDAMSGPFLFEDGGVTEGSVIAAILWTLGWSIAGVGVATLCKKFTPQPANIFVGLVALALLVNGFFAIDAAETTATAVWFNILHFAAAIPVVGSLYKDLQSTGVW